ncbi:MAG: LysM peptidoglycan-binding domain-containing protein [Chloroflexi bacterium]|nr:LysM peptidoglycan-binding domain-containing protein [Chloroflexota bacterium]
MKNRTLIALAGFLLVTALAVTRAQAQDIPNQAYISGVVGHAQQYTLSCESRSAADWAAYWGVNIDETEFLNRLPRSDNPNEGFVGSPNDPWGNIPPASYGVHADPIAALLRDYGLDAHAGLGLSWDEVRTEVAAGRPVIVWVIGSIWAGTAKEYETEDGQTVTVANNEHTMIVIGYDESRVHLVDALTGYTVTHSLENFLNSWSVLGNMAVVGEGNGEDRTDAQPSPAAEGDYTVQRGDTLNKIAARFGLFWPDLAAWNNISYPYFIYPEQILVTSPNGTQTETEAEDLASNENDTYTVQRGDLLLEVARELDVDWVHLAQVNQLAPPYLLVPGAVLQLPKEGADEVEIEIPEFYTATRSESLIGPAKYYRLNWVRLAGMNNLSYPYLLAAGQTIQLR